MIKIRVKLDEIIFFCSLRPNIAEILHIFGRGDIILFEDTVIT